MTRKLSFAVIILLLVGCGAEPSLEAYEKIENGMSLEAVKDLMGEPDSADTVGVADVSGSHRTWETDEFVISVQFINDQVISKQFLNTE